MNETANAPKFSRFIKHIILGGLFGGVLSAIPGLNVLNCLFCLLNMSGVVLALWMHLRANPEGSVSLGESAGFGAIAGAVAGLISGVAASLFAATGTAALASIMGNFPEARHAFGDVGMLTTAVGVMTIPLTMVVFAAFGVLGGVLGMQFFFKSRIRRRS
jgi:hypothetical protein